MGVSAFSLKMTLPLHGQKIAIFVIQSHNQQNLAKAFPPQNITHNAKVMNVASFKSLSEQIIHKVQCHIVLFCENLIS